MTSMSGNDLHTLAQRHAGDVRPGGRGRILAFTSASDQPCHRDIAREFALVQARLCERPIWLLDGDFQHNPHYSALASDGVEGPFDAALREQPFWRVVGDGAPRNAGGLVTLHRHASGLFVTRGHLEKLKPEWRHAFQDAPDYWRKARRYAHSLLLDIPGSYIHGTGRALFAQADATMIVVENRNGQLARARELRDEIIRAGGRCAGAILIEDNAQGLAA